MLIVGGQCLMTLGTIYVLDRILETQYRMETGCALLLCGIYAASFSVLFFCFVGESYALSALILALSFYLARRGNGPVTALLGALAAGTTVTNGVFWAAIVLLSGGSRKKRLLTLATGTALFFALVAAFPVRTVFFQRLIIQRRAEQRPELQRPFRRFSGAAFCVFCLFRLDGLRPRHADAVALRGLRGRRASLRAVSPVGGHGRGVGLFRAARVGVRAHRRDRRLYAPLAVLALNLLLHGVLQYGLKEAFLYSLHHYPAQMLIAGLLLCGKKREKRIALPLLCAYGVCLLVMNVPGYVNLIRFLGG